MLILKNIKIFYVNYFSKNGDWGLGIGDWGFGDWAPTPKPKNPNQNPQPKPPN